MSFWEKVNSGLRKAVEDGWLVVKEGTKVAAGKTDEVTRRGRLRYQVYSLHRKAEKSLTKIGGKVYDIAKMPSKKNPLSNREIINLVDEVNKIEEKVKKIEEQMKAIKKTESKKTSK
jgi:hypothetical protein